MAGRIALSALFIGLIGAPTGAWAAATDVGGAATTAAKTPSKAELGEMLKKCSAEADAKGLTVQKGKSEQRKAFRRACMLKNGVSPRSKS